MARRISMVVGSMFFLAFVAAAPEPAHAGPPKPAQVTINAMTKMVGKMAEATSLPGSLSAGQKAAAAAIVVELRAKKQQDAKAALQTLVRAMAKGALPPAVLSSCRRAKRSPVACKRSYLETEVGALVQWVLREAYIESDAELARFADKVRHFNQQKAAVREYLNQLRAAQSKAAKGTVTVKTVKLLAHTEGKPAFQLATVKVSQVALAALIKKYEQQLSSTGDDAQRASIDLQSLLQKQQHTVQLLSSASKMLQDTAMAEVRKSG